ncbi:MAG: ribosome biogenesis GTPase Der [Pseudomonadota bacterium]
MASISGIVAIVGRPNVGKSTLFNLMTRTNRAITDNQPGVTRDRIYGICERWNGLGFTVVDTGGFETDDVKYQPFSENIVWKQTEAAILESDLVLMILDGKEGFNPHDKELLKYLRSINKKVIFALNKIDGIEQQTALWDFLELVGNEEVYPISSAHNRGVTEFIEQVQESLNEIIKKHKRIETTGAIKVALVGRPNAGKSSILNRLVGEERSLVSEIAGTTRDSLDVRITYNKQSFVLVDTAGIRRKTKILDKIESASVTRSLRAIDEADVVVLVIDAIQGITDQDARLANLVVDRYKPLLIVVNKWDLVPEKDTNTTKVYAENIKNFYLKDMAFLPIIFVSCLENQRVQNILAQVDQLHKMANQRIPTARVNEIMLKIVDSHNPAVVRKFSKRIRFYYATQVRSNPPTVVLMCNIAEAAQESYKRYVTNQFRDLLGFENIPIRVILRDKKAKQGGRAARSEDEMMEMLGMAKNIFNVPSGDLKDKKSLSASRKKAPNITLTNDDDLFNEEDLNDLNPLRLEALKNHFAEDMADLEDLDELTDLEDLEDLQDQEDRQDQEDLEDPLDIDTVSFDEPVFNTTDVLSTKLESKSPH